MRHGFSLVELSIVLVILGLLTGGILTGQNLIRAAELRSVPTEFSAYQTAVNTFKDKYLTIPGDMNNATNFWGVAATGAACLTTPGTGKQTCSGDGDGLIEIASPGSPNVSEEFRSWQHLANAGLIEGSFAGVTDPATAGSSDSLANFNVPASKMSGAHWFLMSMGALTGNADWFANDNGHHFRFAANGQPGVLNPEEAWNVDTKMDDGKPGGGKINVIGRTACTDSSGDSDFDADYLVSADVDCGLVFLKAF